MATPIKFGTDGWRAIIAEDYTFDNVRLCAQASADYFLEHGGAQQGVVVGYDTRFASEDFAVAAVEVLTANGIPVLLTRKAVPTPVTSYVVQSNQAAGAVMITASHNPGGYNGFKLKDFRAGSAPPEMIADVERRITAIQTEGRAVKRLPIADARARGLVREVDPDDGYLDALRRLVGPDRVEAIKNAGITVVVDSMYGAGAGYTARLLEGGATRVIELNGERNPAFPGIAPEPITRNLAKLMAAVSANSAAVGLATDGDADRLGIVDERGQFVTQLQVMSLLALYLLESKGQRGGLVKTITTSKMLDKLGRLFGVPVSETDVGFKYVGPEMERINAVMGGEESGGYGFAGHIPERDGILAGLYFLDFVVQAGRTPSQLLEYLYSKVGPHYYDRLDLHFPMTERAAIIQRVAAAHPEGLGGGSVATVDTFRDDAGGVAGIRFNLEDDSWLLVRFSGTEPVLRIYAETTTPERAQQILREGKTMTGL